MEISQLPAELQESILIHLDGSSLARAQCVCKRWKHYVHNLGKVQNIWFDKCLQEVPLGTLMLLAGHALRRRAGKWEHWLEIYRSWYCSRFVKSWKCNAIWHKKHFTQSSMPDCGRYRSSDLLQFCGDEVVFYDWSDIRRWHSLTGESLAHSDCVVAMGARNNRFMAVLLPLSQALKFLGRKLFVCIFKSNSLNFSFTGRGLTSPPLIVGVSLGFMHIIRSGNERANDSASMKASSQSPCLLIGIGNQIFFFTNSGMKSVQFEHFITCMTVWSRTLLIGFDTGAVDLYTLPDELEECDRSQLLQNPDHLVVPISNNGQVPILHNGQGWLFRQNTTKTTAADVVGNNAFLIRSPYLEVWDIKKKVCLASELYGSTHVTTLVANGIMIFCLSGINGSTVNWFEWSEEKLLPGQTPESVPNNTSCMTLHGDLLALGTAEGLIYLYHLNETTLSVEVNKFADEVALPVSYSWDPVLSFKRMAIHDKSKTMKLVEGAFKQPIQTVPVADCNYVEAVAMSDSGTGPMLAAVGVEAGMTWVKHVHLFSWSPDNLETM